MSVSRCIVVLGISIAGARVSAGEALGAAPSRREMSLRDVWIEAHFPVGSSGLRVVPGAAEPPIPSPPSPELVVWNRYDQVFLNDVPGKGLSIAERKFAHGVYCHAPNRMQVRLPGAARSFSATVGILTNPASVGGSVVFTVEVGGSAAYRSPVLHRGEPGVEAKVALDGATDFFLSVGDAADGIASDQAVWGEATVTLVDGREIRLGDLALRDSWISERLDPTPPFSFLYDGKPSDSFLASWGFRETRDVPRAGTRRRVRTYTDPSSGLAVRNTVVEYADYPTVEWTLDFENTGSADTPIISGIQALDVRLDRPEEGEFTLRGLRGDLATPDSYEPFEEVLGPRSRKEVHALGGRPTQGVFPYWNVEMAGGGVLAVLGWPGQWSANFARDADRALRVHAGQESTRFALHPGELVRSPLAVLQFYEGDWIRGQNLWRRWMVAHGLPRPGGRLVPTHYAGCWSDDLQPRAATETAILDGYLREGIRFDFWIIDAGWYPDRGAWPNTGTWEVDREQFPKGIRQVSDHARANGMKFVLWFEPERAAGGSWLTENHPEWVHGGKDGGLVDLGNREAWNWVVEKIDGLIVSEGVDAYRQDFNIDPLGYWRGADGEDRQGIAEIRHVTGYLAYWDELLRRHPELWIDSCASGGRRNDLETLRRSVPLLRSDYFHDPESQQCHTYGISLWIPYHGSGLGASDEYWFRSCIFPASRVGWDTRKTDLDYPLLRRMVGEFRRVQPYLLGDYYPLTPYSLEKTQWLAWQFDDPAAGGGMVQAFRRGDCAEESRTFPLRGLDPEASYLVEDLEKDAGETLSGRALGEGGLHVTISERRGSALFVYRRR